MIIIEKNKLIFISNPKTGTTYVQKIILDKFKNLKLNRIPESNANNHSFFKVEEHIRTKELKIKMGDSWDEFKSFVFFRDPYDKCVSTYFFYKNGKPITRKDNARKYFVYLNIILVKCLPFWMWFLIKSPRSNYEYILDDDDKFIVNHIGKNESINKDLNNLFSQYKIDIVCSNEKRENVSDHKKYEFYFKNNFVKKIFEYKYSKDLIIQNKIKDIDITLDLKGKYLYDL